MNTTCEAECCLLGLNQLELSNSTSVAAGVVLTACAHLRWGYLKLGVISLKRDSDKKENL